MSLNNAIKRLRKNSDFTQKQVAEQMNIETETYRKIENGKTALTTDRFQQIADILGINPIDIYRECESRVFTNQSLCTNTEKVNNVLNVNKDSERMLDILENLVEEQKATISFLKEQNQQLIILLSQK